MARNGRIVLGVMGAWCLTAILTAAGASSVADAVMQGDREAARALLQKGADVNAAQSDGMTALHWAAVKSDVELAKMLLYAGANVKAATRLGGYTPLLMASKNGDAAMIDALLAGGADPNSSTSNGTTALMLAAASGKADAVTLLLDRKADINAREGARGETALIFAAAYGRTDVIRVLTSRGADVTATTKVVDLSSFAKEEQERFAQFQQGGGRGANARAEGVETKPAEAKAAETKAAEGAKPGAAAAPAEESARVGRNATRAAGKAGVDRQYLYSELVGTQGGLTPLHIAARQGQLEAVKVLLDAGAEINRPSAGDRITPITVAVINGQYDIAKFLLEKGADPRLAEDNGVTPLYAVLNCQWAPKALYPQPRAYEQQKVTYLDLMKSLLDKGADPNVRLKRKVWYSGYNFDLSGVDEYGATPFWRAAYASDVDAMKLLISYGADPNVPTMRTPGRPRTGDGQRDVKDVSGLPMIPVGGPGVPPLLAAAGQGYGEGFAANSHRFAPGGMMAAVKYLIEDLHADVNARDHEGNTALHNAASRGDVEMIKYLVSKGADVKVTNRFGQTTADMANGPVQRIQPFPEALALLESLGAKNNHKCISC
jgi:ankyrin repeat protein